MYDIFTVFNGIASNYIESKVTLCAFTVVNIHTHMSDISLLKATPMHSHLSLNLIHAAKIDIARRSAFHAGCKRDRSSLCMACSRV